MNPLAPASLLLALLPLAAPAGDPAQGERGEDSVLVTYDVRSILPRWDGRTSWSQALLVPPLTSHEEAIPEITGSLEYADFASYELLDLLQQILGDELRRDGRELTVEGDTLTVLAPAALQEQVRAILDWLRETLGGSVTLRVDMLSYPQQGALPAAGLTSEEEAARLVADAGTRGAQRVEQTLELSAGRTALVDQGRRIPYLHDLDVEIAQYMMIYAPVTEETRDGTRLALRGLAQPGGLALSVLLLRSELLGEIALRSLHLHGLLAPEGAKPELVDGPEGIETPEILVRGLAFDTFLPDGKALVVTLEAALGEASVRDAIVLRRAGGSMTSFVARSIPRTNRTLIALNAESFREPRMRIETPLVPSSGMLLPATTASLESEVSGFLLEWLKVRFSVWRRFGPWILVVTDPAWDRDAGAQLERLVKSLRPSTELTMLSADLRDSGVGDGGGTASVRVRLPLRVGSSAGIVLARGTSAVTGYDVEVAQGASVGDPRVAAIFDGLAIGLDVQPSTLQARGLAQVFDGPIGELQLGYAPYSAIERPQPRMLRFDERFALREPRGKPVRIGGGGARGGLALELTLAPMP